MVPPPAAQFTIRPMPARKTACKPVVVVKAEPEVDQQALQAQQLKQQQQQQQLQQLQEEVDAAAFDSDSEDPSSAHGGGKRRRRMRNAKQQELNRLAQQRYRCAPSAAAWLLSVTCIRIVLQQLRQHWHCLCTGSTLRHVMQRTSCTGRRRLGVLHTFYYACYFAGSVASGYPLRAPYAQLIQLCAIVACCCAAMVR